eukprot:3642959-Amphidinium_carterae.1
MGVVSKIYEKDKLLRHILACSVSGAAAVYFGVPAALGTLGFKAAGIAAGSTAASLMASTAAANGGGVVAGGAVAFMQSIAAAGVGTSATITGGVAGGALPLLRSRL